MSADAQGGNDNWIQEYDTAGTSNDSSLVPEGARWYRIRGAGTTVQHGGTSNTEDTPQGVFDAALADGTWLDTWVPCNPGRYVNWKAGAGSQKVYIWWTRDIPR